jgi:hypothetical protein
LSCVSLILVVKGLKKAAVGKDRAEKDEHRERGKRKVDQRVSAARESWENAEEGVGRERAAEGKSRRRRGQQKKKSV